MPLDFIVNGRRVSEHQVKAMAPQKKPAPRNDAPKTFHRGYVAEGYAPGVVEEARRNAEKIRADSWNEAAWKARHKPKRVRSKPYEVASAAEACAELARRAGWTDVRIAELKQGSSDGMLFG